MVAPGAPKIRLRRAGYGATVAPPCAVAADASSGRGEGLAGALKPLSPGLESEVASSKGTPMLPAHARQTQPRGSGSRTTAAKLRISRSRGGFLDRDHAGDRGQARGACRPAAGGHPGLCRVRARRGPPQRRRDGGARAPGRPGPGAAFPGALDRRPGPARRLSAARHRRGRSRRGPGHRRRHRSAARRLRRHPVAARDRPVRGSRHPR